MKETNERLQASGYSLDTREQEQAKINDAFASFSYDQAMSSKGNNNRNSKEGGSKKKK